MFLAGCVLTGIIFALNVSFHDYLPMHPPAYLLPAEDKLKPKYISENGENKNTFGCNYLHAACCPHQDDSGVDAGLIRLVTADIALTFKGFLSSASDLSPPVV